MKGLPPPGRGGASTLPSGGSGDADMIPRKIHYCWFGEAPRSDLNRRCIESWHRVMPDYQIKEWNETNSPLDGPYARAAYDKKLWSKVSNLVRLQALYAEGGIYFDTDVEAIKDFSPLLHDECFVGFQQEEETVDWVNNAVLGARPGHPFLKRCAGLTEKVFEEKGEYLRSPTVMTTVLKEMGLREYGMQEAEGVRVYPIEYFYPYPWFGEFEQGCIKENTYCVHHWEGTWLRKERTRVRRALRIMRRVVRTIIPGRQ